MIGQYRTELIAWINEEHNKICDRIEAGQKVEQNERTKILIDDLQSRKQLLQRVWLIAQRPLLHPADYVVSCATAILDDPKDRYSDEHLYQLSIDLKNSVMDNQYMEAWHSINDFKTNSDLEEQERNLANMLKLVTKYCLDIHNKAVSKYLKELRVVSN